MRSDTGKMKRRTVAGLVAAVLATPAAAIGDGGDAVAAAEAIAVAHLESHMAEIGVEPADLEDLAVTDAYTSEHNGVTHVYLRQRHAGREVLGTSATVNVLDGEVLLAGARFVRDLDHVATGTRILSGHDAVLAAARSVAADPAALTAQPRLVYQALDDGTARLAWNLELDVAPEPHWWNVSVDAESGRILRTVDFVDQDARSDIASRVARTDATAAAVADPVLPPDQVDEGSSYRVYAMPMENPNDGERPLVSNPADAVASPYGWHDTDGAPGPESTITSGNNVNAYADTTNTNLPDPLSQPDGGEALTFDHEIDFRLTPLGYRDAAVTNLFYWNNVMHDVTARYGFTEAAGNFQVTNYTGAGAGGDAVQAEAQDGSGVNNANFGTPADGSSGRMQMYLWPDANETRDGDLDAGIISHEYGHGVSNRLTGGPGDSNCLRHQEREGEGWSDFWSYVLTMREGDDGARPRGVGTYVLHQPNRYGPGIRTTPYSTNMQINPSTYDSVKSAAVPHGVGYVWATMLWDLYWNMVDEYGFNQNIYEDWTTGGNNLTVQLVVDGMKMQVCEPGFVDARDAIIAADVALTGGVNECLIWRTFARRGLGWSADQGSPSSVADGTEAYDLPSQCA